MERIIKMLKEDYKTKFRMLNATEEIEQIKESDKNGQGWFNAYQEIDSFLFEELEKAGKEFPIINQDRPELNTIEAIKTLLNGG